MVRHLRERLRKARNKAGASSVCIQPAGGCVSLPWEEQAEEAISIATEFLNVVNEVTSCERAEKAAGAATAYFSYKAAHGAEAMAKASSKLAAKWGVITIALGIANAAGFC